jgi:hypothetical protein
MTDGELQSQLTKFVYPYQAKNRAPIDAPIADKFNALLADARANHPKEMGFPSQILAGVSYQVLLDRVHALKFMLGLAEPIWMMRGIR